MPMMCTSDISMGAKCLAEGANLPELAQNDGVSPTP